MGKLSSALAIVAFSSAASAETILVGPGDDFTKIEAAQPGDVVEIAPGTYSFRVYLDQQGSAAAPIVIRAADPSQRPVFDLSASLVEDAPGSYTGGDNGRGCWQIAGSHYQVSGIVFRGCHTASGNSAGIRSAGSQSATIRDVLVYESDVGISGHGEDTLVEFSELRDNGRESSPPQHNIYIFGGSFHLRHSFIHDSVGGQNFHIRARQAVIEYNWIARAANYEGDMMTTGSDTAQSLVFRGNVVVGNSSPGNGGQVIGLYDDNGLGNVELSLGVFYNTFVLSSGTNPTLVNVRNDVLGGATVTLSNNVVVGTNSAVSIADVSVANFDVSGETNWFESGADVGALSATLFGADPGFEPGGFVPGAASPLLGAATALAEPPDREYFESEQNPLQFRWRTSAADIGALERSTSGDGYGPYDDPNQPPPGGSGGGAGSSGAGAGGSGASGSGGASAGASGASGASGSASSADDSDDGGCGCRVPAQEPHGAWLVLAAIAGWLLRRSRA